jgi:hypothetical protein
MFTAKGDHHEHDYTLLTYAQTLGRDKDGNREQKVIISRNCACGASEAVDMGTKDEMRKLWQKINRNS